MVAKVVTSSSMFTYSSQSSSQRDMYDLLPTSFSTKHPQWCLSTLFGFIYLILNQCLCPEGYNVSGLACGQWLDEVGLYQLDRANTIIFSTTPHLVMLCWELKVSQSSCLFPYLIWLRALPDVWMHPSSKMNSSVRFLGGWQNISQKILWASIPSLFYPSGGFLCMWSRGGLLDLNERYGHLIFLLQQSLVRLCSCLYCFSWNVRGRQASIAYPHKLHLLSLKLIYLLPQDCQDQADSLPWPALLHKLMLILWLALPF